MLAKMVALLVFLSAGPACVALAQDSDLPPVEYPKLPTAVSARADLVPPGWQVDGEASGDLDGDGRADLALVVIAAKSDLDSSDKPLPGPRMLIVAFGAASGYNRIVANHTLITRASDPYLEDYFDAGSGGLAIDGRKLTIALNFFASAGSWDTWTKTFTFKWNRKAFELTRFDWDSTDRSNGETEDTIIDYARNTIRVTKGNIENEAEATKTSRLPRHRAITLDAIADGIAFDPVKRE